MPGRVSAISIVTRAGLASSIRRLLSSPEGASAARAACTASRSERGAPGDPAPNAAGGRSRALSILAKPLAAAMRSSSVRARESDSR